jgi:Family of unknown function (DUF6370)
MRVVLASILMLAVSIVFLGGVQGGDKDKAVTLKGTITCAKCDLGKETKCMTVIVVKDGKDKGTYYLDDKAGKANHKTICTEAKPGSVTGVVTTKDDKKTITATKVTFDDK